MREKIRPCFHSALPKKREWRDENPATHAESFPRIPVTPSLRKRSVCIVSYPQSERKWATPRCWPKFKTGILERSKLESFGRSKLDARPTVNVDADQSTVQALSLHIQSQSRIPFLSTVRAMLRRLARQLARPVAPGIATVANIVAAHCSLSVHGDSV